ncbi:hypothetical protein HK102_008976, partial [Quaeritorhiza haematococci]
DGGHELTSDDTDSEERATEPPLPLLPLDPVAAVAVPELALAEPAAAEPTEEDEDEEDVHMLAAVDPTAAALRDEANVSIAEVLVNEAETDEVEMDLKVLRVEVLEDAANDDLVEVVRVAAEKEDVEDIDLLEVEAAQRLKA